MIVSSAVRNWHSSVPQGFGLQAPSTNVWGDVFQSGCAFAWRLETMRGGTEKSRVDPITSSGPVSSAARMSCYERSSGEN